MVIITELDINQVPFPADWAVSTVLSAHLSPREMPADTSKCQCLGTMRVVTMSMLVMMPDRREQVRMAQVLP